MTTMTALGVWDGGFSKCQNVTSTAEGGTKQDNGKRLCVSLRDQDVYLSSVHFKSFLAANDARITDMVFFGGGRGGTCWSSLSHFDAANQSHLIFDYDEKLIYLR